MATNNRRGALHTPLDTCRDKLLKFHDEAIKQSLEEREKAYNALHERLAQYEAHIADRIDREWQKKRLDENMARMRSEEARRKREVLERLEDNEKMKNKLRTENTRLRKADDVIIQYGMINSRRRQLISKATATHGDDSATCSDSNREVVLTRQNKSDPLDCSRSIFTTINISKLSAHHRQILVLLELGLSHKLYQQEPAKICKNCTLRSMPLETADLHIYSAHAQRTPKSSGTSTWQEMVSQQKESMVTYAPEWMALANAGGSGYLKLRSRRFRTQGINQL